MSSVKIAVIGAGSYVFGPGVLQGVVKEQRLGGVELALMDVQRDAAGLMAAVGRRMAGEEGLDVRFCPTADRARALDGADFVLCSAAPDMARRFQMDADIVARLCPGHLLTEFGGIAGISYSLRQIAFIRSLAEEMLDVCPDAWLLDVANPLPRVCQAAHELGVNTVGFCYVSVTAYDMLWRTMFGQGLEYPFAEAPDKWEITLGGLNHFSWVLGVRDRASGEDLLPKVRQHLASQPWPAGPLGEEVYRHSGWLLASHDNHTQDFLPPHPASRSRQAMWHGSPQERQARLAVLEEVAAGSRPTADALQHTSWERPVDLIAAMAAGRHVEFHALNLPNDGQIRELPEGVFVETPAVGTSHGPVPEVLSLPEPILPYCRRTAEVTDAIVRAGMERKRGLVHRAVELDPTVIDKPAGLAAMDACLAAHQDMIGAFD